ncbi:hypothetical protein TanjilG_15350 [Lupinus angustifolius]|uniref:Polygalacturonase n=1 Tax=Lupinus angustifolius TaxID=3871 RepID=A0A1J7HEF0_LUPAN|nr:PREDICTED: exopolygalacturonase-like [Lupinus angustifolius]OIW04810.1 hypothetical protein TanjilG_15350 [Lupinus angustifolius]
MARWIILMCLLISIVEARRHCSHIYNVRNYDAIANGKNDDSKAFLKAWSDACKSRVSASVVVPEGTYRLNPIVFTGPCKASITFKLKGTLIAPTNNPSTGTTWIDFRYLNHLTVTGGGKLDGQGASAWGRKNAHPVLMTMGFAFVNNSNINGIRSINSQNVHITMFMCENITLSHLTITAPGQSPNTDGIKMARSQGININNVHIATGDDCVAILTGTKNVNISNVYCGPGHGISVGSFGSNSDEFDIEDIFVKNCTFKGTSNALRIKTWASPLDHPLKASNIVYEDITIIDVEHPINIDQEYCPSANCGNKVSSGVKISNVSYRNIRGTCQGDVAVSFKCSESNPCQDISLENIVLKRSTSSRETLTNRCSHVNGAFSGEQFPPSCI